MAKYKIRLRISANEEGNISKESNNKVAQLIFLELLVFALRMFFSENEEALPLREHMNSAEQ